jgi:hypothetical protein
MRAALTDPNAGLRPTTLSTKLYNRWRNAHVLNFGISLGYPDPRTFNPKDLRQRLTIIRPRATYSTEFHVRDTLRNHGVCACDRADARLQREAHGDVVRWHLPVSQPQSPGQPWDEQYVFSTLLERQASTWLCVEIPSK